MEILGNAAHNRASKHCLLHPANADTFWTSISLGVFFKNLPWDFLFDPEIIYVAIV
jgi:hypothetical protein